MIEKIKEFFGDIADSFRDFYIDFFVVPYERTCRFFYWGWKLKKNYEFCSSSVYYMTYLQLDQIIKYSRKHGHCVWNTQENGTQFRRLKIACELAKRLHYDNYSINIKKHKKKWDCNILNDMYSVPSQIDKDGKILTYRVKWRSEDNLSKEELTHKHEEFSKAHKLDDLQRQNEKDYYYTLLNKHMDSW